MRERDREAILRSLCECYATRASPLQVGGNFEQHEKKCWRERRLGGQYCQKKAHRPCYLNYQNIYWFNSFAPHSIFNLYMKEEQWLYSY
jgi:hypothetical protein